MNSAAMHIIRRLRRSFFLRRLKSAFQMVHEHNFCFADNLSKLQSIPHRSQNDILKINLKSQISNLK